MVGTTMARIPSSNLCCIFFYEDEPSPSETLGVLAFDATKTMCRLVSLYKSLTDVEIHKLRRHIIKSKGVSHLNSPDEFFLLNLACAERLEDLNLAAAAVSRLGSRCSDKNLSSFDAVYADLKCGAVDVRRLEPFGTRNVERVVDKMEKLVNATRNLHMAMESLSEMEASERKIQRWRAMRANHGLKVKVECFNDRIVFHRRQVQYYKQMSLWNQTFDNVVGLMAHIICIVYARICFVFGSLLTGVPGAGGGSNKNNVARGVFRMNLENSCCQIEHRELYRVNLCVFDRDEESLKRRAKNAGQVLKSARTGVIRFNNNIHAPPPAQPQQQLCGCEVVKNNGVLRLAPTNTVGGAGLSQRYASVILFMERCVYAAAVIGEDARAALYELLPGRLRGKLKGELRRLWLKRGESVEGREEGWSAVAERWQVSVEEVMDWLAPLAHDTLRWQAERNLEKQKYETKPTVLLLQTLHYSDLEKVEKAIVEVLVGLSRIYWHQKQW